LGKEQCDITPGNQKGYPLLGNGKVMETYEITEKLLQIVFSLVPMLKLYNQDQKAQKLKLMG
jgi:hypothetical protein